MARLALLLALACAFGAARARVLPGPRPLPPVPAAVSRCAYGVSRGIDMGVGISRVYDGVSTPKACCQACFKDPVCLGWTLVVPPDRSSPILCSRIYKPNFPDFVWPYRSPIAISGFSKRFPGLKRPPPERSAGRAVSSLTSPSHRADRVTQECKGGVGGGGVERVGVWVGASPQHRISTGSPRS